MPSMGMFGSGANLPNSPFSKDFYDEYGSTKTIGGKNRSVDYSYIRQLLADGNEELAYQYARKLFPDMDADELWLRAIAPAMLENAYQAPDINYSGFQMNQMNRIGRQQSDVAKRFSQSYGGLKGAPELESYIGAMAPFMSAREQTATDVFGMKREDAYKESEMKQMLADKQIGLKKGYQDQAFRQEQLDLQKPEEAGIWDYIGSGLNVASKILPFIPGIGTATGVAAGAAGSMLSSGGNGPFNPMAVDEKKYAYQYN